MADNVSATGVSQLAAAQSKAFYPSGNGKNGQRVNHYQNLELQTVWAGATSASLTLTNKSEHLTIVNSTATNAVAVNFNSNTAALANSGANLLVPPLFTVEVPMADVLNINHIASSGSIRLTVANYY